MGTGSIGSIGSISFWQQDQNYWTNAAAEAQTATASDSLITDMATLTTNETKGLASIANKTALDRVNAQLTSALKSAVQQSEGASSSSSSGASAPTLPDTPATGTGTVPLTTGTSLLTLGIPATGTITVSDGTNTTTFASTGTDTVGDLINAINTSGPKNAQANAYLNGSGDLVITAQNNTDTIAVGGLFASNVGFGTTNESFSPAAPSSAGSASDSSSASSSSASSSASSSTASSSSAGSSSSATSGSTASSASSSTVPSKPVLFNSSPELQTNSATATFLQSGIASGSVINLLV
jgi:hypothetical protein